MGDAYLKEIILIFLKNSPSFNLEKVMEDKKSKYLFNKAWIKLVYGMTKMVLRTFVSFEVKPPGRFVLQEEMTFMIVFGFR